jgi:hypothetical protein
VVPFILNVGIVARSCLGTIFGRVERVIVFRRRIPAVEPARLIAAYRRRGGVVIVFGTVVAGGSAATATGR